RRLNPRVVRDLETIGLKCLQKEPARRYASAAELADDLRRYHADEPISARPASFWERTRKWVRRRPAVPALLRVGAHALLRLLGQNEAARASYTEAIRFIRALADDFPDEPAHRHSLADVYNWLGEVERAGGHGGKAEAAYDQARRLQMALVERYPDEPGYR